MSLSLLRRASALLLAVLCFSTGAQAQSTSLMAIMGDAGRSGTQLDNLKKSILAENIQSLILPGDNLYSGTYSSVWDSWKSAGLRFDVVAIGNHNSGYSEEVSYFSMPGEFYSVEKFGARFFVLNSDNQSLTEQQMNWLENQMNQVKEKLVFLVYHHPTFTVSDHHTWDEKRKFQLRMRKFLRDHGSKITALLLGHDHMSSFLTFGDIPVVIAGAGREVRNETPVSYFEAGFQIETRYLAPRRQHWALLEISNNAQSATVHFVRVQDQQRSCSADLGTGSLRLRSNCSQD